MEDQKHKATETFFNETRSQFYEHSSQTEGDKAEELIDSKDKPCPLLNFFPEPPFQRKGR